MPMSHFSGFKDGVTIRGVPVVNVHSDEVFWVSSTSGSDGNKGSYAEPFATIDYAIGKCTASRGAIIFVKAGHAENLSTADFDLDVAGVSIVGLGTGRNRPVITYTGTTDTTKFDISAANCGVYNIVFNLDSNDAVDTAITINGDSAEVAYCEFYNGSTGQPDTFITVGLADGDSDYAWIHDNVFLAATAGNASAVLVGYDHTGVRIENNIVDGDFSTAGISVPTLGDANLQMVIRGNYVRNVNAGDWAIEVIGTTTTGVCADNRLVTDAQATALDAGTLTCMGNLWNISTGGDTEGVPVNPVADSVVNYIGTDDADNAALTSSVAANRDGSVLERLEAVYAAQVDDVATNFIGVDDADNVAATTLVAANANGSLLERDEQLQQLAAMAGFYNSGNYLAVTADLTSATWNTVAAHEIATVTGAVRMLILPQCTDTVVTTGTNGTFILGDETNTSSLIASSLLDALVTGEWWVDATITRTIVTRTQMNALEFVIGNGKDVGYTIGTNAATNGTIVFHIWWVAIDATGAVAAGAGGVL